MERPRLSCSTVNTPFVWHSVCRSRSRGYFRLNCAEGALSLLVAMFAPRKTPAVSRNCRTQGISNRASPAITALVEIACEGLPIYIAGKVVRAEDRSEGSTGRFGIADVSGDCEIVRNITNDS